MSLRGELSDRAARLALRGAYLALRAWWFLRRPHFHGAHVAVWSGDRLLLIRNSYRSGEAVPGGGIGRRESPREAARRELREEVGLRVDGDALEFACEIVVRHEHKRDHAHFFELRLADGAEPAIRVDGREVVWGAFCPAADLGSRPLTPHLREYLRRRTR